MFVSYSFAQSVFTIQFLPAEELVFEDWRSGEKRHVAYSSTLLLRGVAFKGHDDRIFEDLVGTTGIMRTATEQNCRPGLPYNPWASDRRTS